MTAPSPSAQTPSLRERLFGCWLGKAVGGTLGQTFEGLEGPLDADFYFPVPEGMVANDDLDLQVVSAVVLDRLESPTVDRHVLADAWRTHVRFPWNEYGVAVRNLAEGLEPPHTGSFDNWFSRGEGAAIRSELWACLAPGDPDLASAYAYEDACFDHDGEGIHAAQFLARLQSLAFVESDPDVLLDTALAGLPGESGITAVVQDTRRWCGEHADWTRVRSLIVDRYGLQDFTDVRMNTGFVVLGWLLGRDFSESILITNNCGEDCDSSTASLGALLGILDPSSIDERWLAPIGSELVLNPEIIGLEPPATLEEFTDLVLRLRDRLGGAAPTATSTAFDPSSRRLPVRIAHFNTVYSPERWLQRDQSGLPAEGVPLPALEYAAGELDGTWARLPRERFEDRLLMIEYPFNGRGVRDVRLMVTSTEDYRLWLDGVFLHAAQGTGLFFPAPHMAPVGQFVDVELDDGPHTLSLALRRPPVGRDTAEWVTALVERPSMLWIPNALRT